MTWLSDDPWLLVSVLGALAGGLLIALKVTQNGKYLIGAGVAILLAVAVLGIEHFWVTEAEKIEAIVLDMGRAVKRADAEAALQLMTPDVTLIQGGSTLGVPQLRTMQKVAPGIDVAAVNPARALIRAAIDDTTFDIVSISRVRTHAGKLTRMGTADFRVYASGTHRTGQGAFNFATGTSGSDWSMGFREVDGQWKIDRITAVRLPPNFRIPGM